MEDTVYSIIEENSQSKRYVQVKFSKFKTKTIIQIIDISNSIMFDQQKAQNEFLNVINACVSHELRNPLNSISAQNMLKKHLYAKLKKIKVENEKTQKLLDGIVKDLEQGLEI